MLTFLFAIFHVFSQVNDHKFTYARPFSEKTKSATQNGPFLVSNKDHRPEFFYICKMLDFFDILYVIIRRFVCSLWTNSGVPGAEGYNNTCYCPGNPALDPNLLNLTGALRRAQARNIFIAPGIRYSCGIGFDTLARLNLSTFSWTWVWMDGMINVEYWW